MAIACLLLVQDWNKVSVVPVVKAQDAPVAGKKYVDVEQDSPRFAARVVKVTVGNQIVIPGEFRPHKGPSGVPFQAGDDWLKELTFTIKNRSSKTFVWLHFGVAFPDTLAACSESITGECQTGWSMELGRIPENAAYTPEGKKLNQGSRQPIDFRPGQEMEISLAPYADELRRRIEERQPFSTISRCFINVNLGYFEDGMMWSLADYNVPDPSHYPWYKPADESQIPVKDKRATYAPNEAHD
jgi:hypothetical protein